MTLKQFRTYYWLVNTIKDGSGLTFEEINRLWQENKYISDGLPMNKRTFMRYRNEIESLFGLEISIVPHSKYKYAISNLNDLYDDSIHQWMMRTLVVRQMLIDNTQLHDRILLEPIPSGEFHLTTIIESMKDNKRVEVYYKKYEDADVRLWKLSPYCLKMYNRRWYMLGKTDKGTLCTFALDRMEEVKTSNETFMMDPDFRASEYFCNMYGICRNSDSKIQRIVIRTYNDEHHYLRDLPIHESQREIGRGENYVDFELKVYPTMELAGFILSRGKRMEVIRPKTYARKLNLMRGGYEILT